MGKGAILGEFVYPLLSISVIYIFSFYAAIYWLLPFQEAFFPNLTNFASLLFLPHGVRVLSA